MNPAVTHLLVSFNPDLPRRFVGHVAQVGFLRSPG
jgi:hypothetical protein